MPRKLLTWLGLLSMAGCTELPAGPADGPPTECPPVSGQLDRLIAAEADKVRGAEYCQFRTRLQEDDLELVLYTIESPCYHDTRSAPGSCGNHFYRALIGLKDGALLAPVTVGERGSFIARTLRWQGESLVISGAGYRPSDPLCCPGTTAEKRYRIVGQHFEETAPEGAGP